MIQKRHIRYTYDIMLTENGDYYNHFITYSITYKGVTTIKKKLTLLREDDTKLRFRELYEIILYDIFNDYYDIQQLN